jgi:hypothetical protein
MIGLRRKYWSGPDGFCSVGGAKILIHEPDGIQSGSALSLCQRTPFDRP